MALLVTASCASLPSERQIQQFLGLEPSFAHNDVPAPPTPAAYVLQFAMSQATQVVVNRAGSAQYEATDPQVLRALLNVLRAGVAAQASAGMNPPQTSLQLDFIVDSPRRVVTVHYNPATHILQMYNVPTAAWPDHAVAAYTMTPAFGAALEQVAGLNNGHALAPM